MLLSSDMYHDSRDAWMNMQLHSCLHATGRLQMSTVVFLSSLLRTRSTPHHTQAAPWMSDAATNACIESSHCSSLSLYMLAAAENIHQAAGRMVARRSSATRCHQARDSPASKHIFCHTFSKNTSLRRLAGHLHNIVQMASTPKICITSHFVVQGW